MIWQGITFGVSLIGICAAMSLVDYPPSPPRKTNMYAPPPTNPYKEAVAATGIVEAFGQNTEMGVAVEGLVQEVHVRVGDRVQKGDLLIIVDDRILRAQVEVAKQNIEVASATLGKNLSQLERLHAVNDTRAVSIEDVRNKEYDVEVARQQLELAKQNLQEAYVALDRTKIVAPKEGVVLRCELRPGEFAASVPTDSIDPLTPALIIGDVQKLQIRADIDEQNAYRIRQGQEAIGYTRGTLLMALPLNFDHIEPYVIPKRNLSSAANERIDTRVLQVIYTFEPKPEYPIYVGQLVDVFINAPVGLP